MTPLIEVNKSVLKTLNPKDYTRRADLENILKKDETGLMGVYELGKEKFVDKLPIPKEFYKKQKINLKMLEEINKYFGDAK